jgi:hypothetical protein
MNPADVFTALLTASLALVLVALFILLHVERDDDDWF